MFHHLSHYIITFDVVYTGLQRDLTNCLRTGSKIPSWELCFSDVYPVVSVPMRIKVDIAMSCVNIQSVTDVSRDWNRVERELIICLSSHQQEGRNDSHSAPVCYPVIYA